MDVSPIPPRRQRVHPDQARARTSATTCYIPSDHPQGLHWYHAHVHHFVEDQIGSGVSGMLIVDGFIEQQYPELAGLRQRVMVFKDFTFPGFKDGDARAKSLNGYANPPIRSRPGEFQIWEIGNLGADAMFDLKLEGHTFWVLERDGNLLLKPVQQSHVFLPPGARGHRGGRGRGRRARYACARSTSTPARRATRTRTSRSAPSSSRASRSVAAGPSWHGCARGRPTPASIQPNPNQLRKAKISRTRYVDFSESAERRHVLHQQQDLQREPRRHDRPARARPSAGSSATTRGEMHVFHLHQTEFLVNKFSGTPDQTLGLRHARRDQHPLRARAASPASPS